MFRKISRPFQPSELKGRNVKKARVVKICCPSVVYSKIKYPNGTDLLERYEKRTKEYKTTVRDKTQTSYDIILLSFKDSKRLP